MTAKEAAAAQFRALLARPDFPDPPTFFEELERLFWEAHNQGKRPNVVYITERNQTEADAFGEAIRKFQDAWGIPRPSIIEGTLMIHSYRGIPCRLGPKLAVVEEK